MNGYYYKNPGEGEKGPFSASELRQLAQAGQIDPAAQVRAAHKTTWHLASSVKGLFPTGDTEKPQAPEGGDAATESEFNEEDVFLPPPLIVQAESCEPALSVPAGVEVNEDRIRTSVENRADKIEIVTERFTPSGKLRNQPIYVATVYNSYLDKAQTIRKKSRCEAELEARRKLREWKEEEIAKRISAARSRHLALAQKQTASLAQQAKSLIDRLGNILTEALDNPPAFDWDRYIDRRTYDPFVFEPEPERPTVPAKPPEPRRNWFCAIFPLLWELRVKRCQRALAIWQEKRKRLENEWRGRWSEWNKRREVAFAEYENAKRRFLEDQLSRNQAVSRFRDLLTQGHPKAIEKYLEELFRLRRYPETFRVSHRVRLDSSSSTLVIDLSLPNENEVADIVDYKFVKKNGQAVAVRMKKKDHQNLYDSAVKQAVLRTIYESLVSTEASVVEAVVVNGWVDYIDPGTGREKTSCIISVLAAREQFEGFDLRRVDPTECIKNLKGLVAGPLSQIAPVRPIMQLDRSDERFVESREVLAELNSTTNLAEIGWEEFEHLVRELFTKMFSQKGAEVHVTRASSDGGVDAIAFDPDPIRGGKFVIQAKRYTKVVPVSAVRDLYGTMIAEGASKGILVTTAHFGRDSREFVKDKPISLIDGANLVYLLEEFGYKVTIDVKAAREKENRNPLAR